MGGIFVVLLAGLGVACITACVEYLWTGRQANRDRKVGHRDMQAMFKGVSHLYLVAIYTVSLNT